MNWLINLISWILSFWDKIPQKIKEEIVDIITETFRYLLEMFYDWFSDNKNAKKSN